MKKHDNMSIPFKLLSTSESFTRIESGSAMKGGIFNDNFFTFEDFIDVFPLDGHCDSNGSVLVNLKHVVW